MLQNKKIVILLSVVLSIILWVYVIEDVNPVIKSKIEDVNIQILNKEVLSQRGLALVGTDEYKIDIIVEGKRSDIAKLSKGDIYATADVFGYSVGENYIPVAIKLPKNIELTSQSSYKIPVKIEEIVSLYKNVEVRYKGNLEPKQEPIIYETAPWEVEVKGAKSKIANVNAVVAYLDVNKLEEKKSIAVVDLKALNKKGKEIKGVEFSSSIVEIEAGIGYTKKVDLDIIIEGEVGEQLEVSHIGYPKGVYIKGEKETIEKIEKLETENINLNGIKTTTEIPLNIKLPKGVRLSSKNPEPTVEVVIKGILMREYKIKNSEIQGENLGENLSFVINTSNLKLKISGAEDIVNNLTSEDFKIYVDLNEKKAGIHTVPVEIKKPEGLKNVEVEPKEIHVTVNEII